MHRNTHNNLLKVNCRPLPIELPTEKEWRLDASQIDSLKAAVSPVFYSVSPDTSEVIQGLASLNLKAGRPVLLVGNHQTIPVDIAPLVEGVRSVLRNTDVTIGPTDSLYMIWNRSKKQAHISRSL